ncbi:MAG: bacteriocin immunity protein [Ectopseudomonas guguanensis]|uniref:bacteriocin immunity protein n=1 Tax=Ectopseudomonas guguanensis TaxID=1198456 RepID=UPI003918BA0B
MDYLSKAKIEEYTEAEFIQLLREFFENPRKLRGAALEAHLSELSLHFKAVVEHPSGTDLIFYPAAGVEDSPEGVLSEVKKWRKENGLPGFKE